MIFVTGGTGLVGSHLLFKLVQEGSAVKALYRSEEKLQNVKHVFNYYTSDADILFEKITWIKGDILDINVLQDSIKDALHVYHCAALISFDPNDYYKLRKTNIEGTANIVNACIDNAVSKLCYVSSIAAIGDELDSNVITEESAWNPEIDHNVYAITKYGAEMQVWRGTQEGLDAVIINPGIIIGGGFWHSGSGSLFKKIYKGLSHYSTGSTGYVDVDDVVTIMTGLMSSTIKNERFILISENLSFKEFAECVAENLHVNAPVKKVKNWQLQLAWRLDWLRSVLTKKRRRFTKQLATSVMSSSQYSNNKIILALKHSFIPMRKSIKQASNLFLKDL